MLLDLLHVAAQIKKLNDQEVASQKDSTLVPLGKATLHMLQLLHQIYGCQVFMNNTEEILNANKITDPLNIQFKINSLEVNFSIISTGSHVPSLMVENMENIVATFFDLLAKQMESLELTLSVDSKFLLLIREDNFSSLDYKSILRELVKELVEDEGHKKIIQSLCNLIVTFLANPADQTYLKKPIQYVVTYGLFHTSMLEQKTFNTFMRAIGDKQLLVRTEIINQFPPYILNYLFTANSFSSNYYYQHLQLFNKEVIQAVEKGNVLFLLLIFLPQNIELSRKVLSSRASLSATINKKMYWLFEHALLDALKIWINNGGQIEQNLLNSVQQHVKEKIAASLSLIVKESCPWFKNEAIKNGIAKTLAEYPETWLFEFTQQRQLTQSTTFFFFKTTPPTLLNLTNIRLAQLRDKISQLSEESKNLSTSLSDHYRQFITDCYIKRVIIIQAYCQTHLKYYTEHEKEINTAIPIVAENQTKLFSNTEGEDLRCVRVNEIFQAEDMPTNLEGEKIAIPPWFAEQVLRIEEPTNKYIEDLKEMYIPTWFTESLLPLLINPLHIKDNEGNTLLHIAMKAWVSASNNDTAKKEGLFAVVVLLLHAGLNFDMENTAKKNVYKYANIEPLSSVVLEAKHAASHGSKFQDELKIFLNKYDGTLKSREDYKSYAFFNFLFDFFGIFTHTASRQAHLKELNHSLKYSFTTRNDIPILDKIQKIIHDEHFPTGKTGATVLRSGLKKIVQNNTEKSNNDIPTLFYANSENTEDSLLRRKELEFLIKNNSSPLPIANTSPLLTERPLPPTAKADEISALKEEITKLQQQTLGITDVQTSLAAVLKKIEQLEKQLEEKKIS